MAKDIFVTRAGVICGGFEGDASPASVHAGFSQGGFVSLEEALDWLPINLRFKLAFGTSKFAGRWVDMGHMKDLTVCPVRKTNEELGALSDLKVMRRERHQFFAMIAAMQAMEGVHLTGDPTRYACVGATGGAGLLSNFQVTLKLIQQKKISPFDNLKYLPNTFVGEVAQRFGLQGPSEVHGTACAASGDAITSLIRMILLGEVDGGLVVGADAAISEFGLSTFARQGALGNGLTFQTGRTGFVMGEGAGALFIETRESMERNQREPICQIIGYASGSDANSKIAITAPDPKGQALTAEKALVMAGIGLDEVDILSVHGTATDGDPRELEGLKLLGSKKMDQLKIIAPKTWIGHLLGAASVVETAMLARQLQTRHILPTRGLMATNLDPDCDVVEHVVDWNGRLTAPRPIGVRNSFGFAQTNSTHVLRAA